MKSAACNTMPAAMLKGYLKNFQVAF